MSGEEKLYRKAVNAFYDKERRKAVVDKIAKHAKNACETKGLEFFKYLWESRPPADFDRILGMMQFRFLNEDDKPVDVTRVVCVKLPENVVVPTSMDELDELQQTLPSQDPTVREYVLNKNFQTRLYPDTERWKTVLAYHQLQLVELLREFYVDQAAPNLWKQRLDEIAKTTTRILKTGK